MFVTRMYDMFYKKHNLTEKNALSIVSKLSSQPNISLSMEEQKRVLYSIETVLNKKTYLSIDAINSYMRKAEPAVLSKPNKNTFFQTIPLRKSFNAKKEALLLYAIKSTIESFLQDNSSNNPFINSWLSKITHFLVLSPFNTDSINFLREFIHTIPSTIKYYRTNEMIQAIIPEVVNNPSLMNHQSNRSLDPLPTVETLEQNAINTFHKIGSLQALIYLMLSSEHETLTQTIEHGLEVDKSCAENILYHAIYNYCIHPNIAEFKKTIYEKFNNLILQEKRTIEVTHVEIINEKCSFQHKKL